MPYDNFKKQAPRYWREGEMLAMLESRMNNATSMTELAMWFEFSKSLSTTVKGFFAKLILCKDQNKMRLMREASVRELAESALGVPLKATLVNGPQCDPGEKGDLGEPGITTPSEWVEYNGERFRYVPRYNMWEDDTGTLRAEVRFNR